MIYLKTEGKGDNCVSVNRSKYRLCLRWLSSHVKQEHCLTIWHTHLYKDMAVNCILHPFALATYISCVMKPKYRPYGAKGLTSIPQLILLLTNIITNKCQQKKHFEMWQQQNSLWTKLWKIFFCTTCNIQNQTLKSLQTGKKCFASNENTITCTAVHRFNLKHLKALNNLMCK